MWRKGLKALRDAKAGVAAGLRPRQGPVERERLFHHSGPCSPDVSIRMRLAREWKSLGQVTGGRSAGATEGRKADSDGPTDSHYGARRPMSGRTGTSARAWRGRPKPSKSGWFAGKVNRAGPVARQVLWAAYKQRADSAAILLEA